MTEQERTALKAELMQEIKAEFFTGKINSDSAKCLQPILDKWCNGDRRPHGGMQPCNGPLIEALSQYKGLNSWEHIRRLTCNIMDVSYVRDIKDVERARSIADRLCEVVTELAKEQEAK